MLGSSEDSAHLAARMGLPYNLALFINPQASPTLMDIYHSEFQPSALQPEPRAMITLTALCAETEDAAERLRVAADVNFLSFVTRGPHIRFLSPEETEDHVFSARELEFLTRYEGSRAIGVAG